MEKSVTEFFEKMAGATFFMNPTEEDLFKDCVATVIECTPVEKMQEKTAEDIFMDSALLADTYRTMLLNTIKKSIE